MPTLAQLKLEPAFDLEFQPPALETLCRRLTAFYGVPRGYIGSKGNEAHLRGYHRSWRWLRDSRWCTNRTYSRTETPGNRDPWNGDALSAIDATIPRTPLLETCRRLDAAVRAGRLEKITEWYGNTDGDDRVDGYNNIANRVASSDSSHLWHLHMSFDRGRVNENHDDLYAILTGDDDMAHDPSDPHWWREAQRMEGIHSDLEVNAAGEPNKLRARLVRLEEKLDAMSTGGIDVAALAAALAPLLKTGATVDEVRDVMDEQLDQAFSKADPRGVDAD